MSDPANILTLAFAGMAAIAIVAAAALRGWQEWLQLRRIELGERAIARPGTVSGLTDLRARVRRLEAIASGSES